MKRELRMQFKKVKNNLTSKSSVWEAFNSMQLLLEIILLHLQEKEEIMDEKIKKIIKDTKGLEKKEQKLLKLDKKHDKIVEKAKKKLKKK